MELLHEVKADRRAEGGLHLAASDGETSASSRQTVFCNGTKKKRCIESTILGSTATSLCWRKQRLAARRQGHYRHTVCHL